MSQKEIAVILPFYNEAHRLEPSYILDNAEKIGHWIFVNDGSTDKTNELLQQLVEQLNSRDSLATLVSLSRNVGKGEAVRAGLVEAANTSCDIVGYLDADFSSPVSEFVRLATLLRESDYDIMMGARVALMGRDVERSNTRHYVGRVSATLISIVLNLRVYDTQAGIKLLKRACLPGLIDQPFISRWLFDCELLVRANRVNLQFAEEPLYQWKNREGSKVNTGSYIKSLADLMQIKYHYRS